MIRIVLADDHQILLAGLKRLIESKGDMEVVAMATDATTAIEAAHTHRPDVLVLDISMPIVTGLEIVACLRDAGSRAALVFLTVHDEEDTVSAARAAGGIGYVVKSRLGSDLRFAVEEAIAGRQFVSPIP